VIPMLVVPTLTRHDLLKRMLGSVDSPVGHLVVVENSGRGFVLPDGPWEQGTVLRMPSNLGVAASWNLAIKMAHKWPWVMVASDDMWWPAGTLAKFAEKSGEDRLVVSATWPHWCAFTIGMRVVEKVGLFDEGYYPAYFEDTEYERRLKEHGVERLMGPTVHHDNSSTLSTPGANFVRRQSLAANERLFKSGKHHGFDPYRWRAQTWT
jgi:GT2 family glycosyltransferase